MEAPADVYTMRPVIPQNRTDSNGRITISNIPPGVTEAQLVANLKHHGDAKVHMFVPGCEYSAGWAWISFPTNEEVQRVLETASWKARCRAAAEDGDNSKVPAPTRAESIFKPQHAEKVVHGHCAEADETSDGESAAYSCSEPAVSEGPSNEHSDEGEAV